MCVSVCVCVCVSPLLPAPPPPPPALCALHSRGCPPPHSNLRFLPTARSHSTDQGQKQPRPGGSSSSRGGAGSQLSQQRYSQVQGARWLQQRVADLAEYEGCLGRLEGLLGQQAGCITERDEVAQVWVVRGGEGVGAVAKRGMRGLRLAGGGGDNRAEVCQGYLWCHTRRVTCGVTQGGLPVVSHKEGTCGVTQGDSLWCRSDDRAGAHPGKHTHTCTHTHPTPPHQLTPPHHSPCITPPAEAGSARGAGPAAHSGAVRAATAAGGTAEGHAAAAAASTPSRLPEHAAAAAAPVLHPGGACHGVRPVACGPVPV